MLTWKHCSKLSDVVSIHVPLLPATRHLIGAKELATMKPTAYLINTSRGPVIDEIALTEALKIKLFAEPPWMFLKTNRH